MRLFRTINTPVALAVLLTAVMALSKVQPASAATCNPLPTTVGSASESVTIPATGTYRVWAHMYAPSSSNDSFYLQIGNTSYCKLTIGGGSSIQGNTFTWVDYQNGSPSSPINVTLNKGTYTLNMAGITSGVGVDELLFTGDMNCTPKGDGSNCESAPNVTTPVSGTNLPTVSVGGTNSGLITVRGTIRLTTPLAPAGSKVTYAIDGKTISGDTLNTSTLSPGKHTITSTVVDPKTGKKTTYTRVIDVALAAQRPTHKSSTAVVVGSTAAAVVVAGGVGYAAYWYRKRRGHTPPLLNNRPERTVEAIPVAPPAQVITPTNIADTTLNKDERR